MLADVRLAQLRRRAVLSQTELAERAGVSKATIVKLEGGSVRRPHPRTVRALSAVLGVEPREVDEFRHAVDGD